jgi:hypothetical protein
MLSEHWHCHSLPSPGEGGSRATSALTRVFAALWRAGWGELLRFAIHPTPLASASLRQATLPLQGRVDGVCCSARVSKEVSHA